MSDASADIAGPVRIDVLRGGSVVDSQTIVPASMTLPNGQPAVGGDAFFALRPGTYSATATVLDTDGGPSSGCTRATTTANVAAARTTEIALNVFCGGEGTGALDVIVTVGSPPVITNLRIEPSKFLQAAQPVYLTAVAASSGHDLPLTYTWSVPSSPSPAAYELNQFGDTANFHAQTPGDYLLMVEVTDAQGRSASLQFPIHVTDMTVHASGGAERPCRSGDESLEEFSARCDRAMGGVAVPPFDCDDPSATEPPRQQTDSSGDCGAPNVLNQQCDPGSHFHVLHRDEGGDGIFIVAHCRKKARDGNASGQYGDVAVIQYNSNTGATCFYQALRTGLPHDAPAPRTGNISYWLTPHDTQSINCVRCHDTGPFIRSPYLAQLGQIWPFYGDANNAGNSNRPSLPASNNNYLPGTLQADLAGAWNHTMPYGFTGLNFQSWEAYSVTDSADPSCTTCHRMGTSRTNGFWNLGAGTANDLGIRATAASQASKFPDGKDAPGVSSPIWMTPGQIKYDPSFANHATSIQKCAQSIDQGAPTPGCSASPLAAGDMCPPQSTVVNGGTAADDPKSWKGSGKQTLGQPGGKIGFYYFSSVHGPFYQDSPFDSYMNSPPSVATPAWDPPGQAPAFRGTYLRLYSEPPGQWTVAWGVDATDLKNSNGTPPPPGGPGGQIDGIAFDQIDSVPDPGNCGSGYHFVSDPTGHNAPLNTMIDNPAGTSAAMLTGFIGNVSRGIVDPASATAAFLQIQDDAGRTVLAQSHPNNPNPAVNDWFTAESWSSGCANWQAATHYAVHRVQSFDDVLLVPAADVPNVICYIDGIAGDWSQWITDGQGGSLQPYAQIYIDASTGYHLKVWPTGRANAGPVAAFATCLYLKK